MMPFLEINSLIPRNSEFKLTVNAFEIGTCPGGLAGVGASLEEHAAAKQETQAAAIPPVTVCKN
jgi:hypothetical protein